MYDAQRFYSLYTGLKPTDWGSATNRSRSYALPPDQLLGLRMTLDGNVQPGKVQRFYCPVHSPNDFKIIGGMCTNLCLIPDLKGLLCYFF